MGALKRYLEPILSDFDVSGLLDPDVESIESDVYAAHIIYKYFSSSRRQFLKRPQLRFSQREALNDPFEMSHRWKAASADGLKRLVERRLKDTLPKVLLNKQLQKEIFREEMKKIGRALSALEEINSIYWWLATNSHRTLANCLRTSRLLHHCYSMLLSRRSNLNSKPPSRQSRINSESCHLQKPPSIS